MNNATLHREVAFLTRGIELSVYLVIPYICVIELNVYLVIPYICVYCILFMLPSMLYCRSKMIMRQLTEAEIDTTGQAMMRRATNVMNRRVLDIARRIQVF